MNLSDILEEFKKYLGYDGIISQKDLDQGDSAQRCGHYLSYMGLLDQQVQGYYQHVFSKLQVSPGVYRRSSNLDFWGSDPSNLSRDQRTGLESAMVVWKDLSRLKESRTYILKRFGFHQNTNEGTDGNKKKVPDIVSPGELRLWSSRENLWERYVWDLSLFGDLALRKDDNYDSDNMLAMNMLMCYCVNPTWISKLAMKKYLKTNFMDRVYNYHRVDGQHNGCEPMAWLTDYAYWKLVSEYKSKQQFE